MPEPYDILGVDRTASAEQIRAAYRRLAKQSHPDLHPGDKAAEARFKQVNAAYTLLSDPEKRQRFDAGEIDAEGQERPEHAFYRSHADGGDGAKYHRYEGFSDFDSMDDVFAEMLRRGGRDESGFNMRGGDVTYTMSVGFVEAAGGTKKQAAMPDGKTLNVSIPEGLRDGQTLRLKGQGGPGIGGGPPGDAYIEVRVLPHKFFSRKDNNTHMTLPVTLGEAVLGGKVKVPTVSGPVELRIPKGSNTGSTLRLRGKGILDKKSGQRGDQYVQLQVVLPDAPDEELAAFLAEWAAKRPYDPRGDLGEAV
ncbi:MAG: J domain-containing protein [Alphaproteobacteria bacterium]|nr:J domain-containing protein [Alphaproteobacteria bacterium]